MINICTKKCCEDCADIDLEINTVISENVIGQSKVCATVYCTHQTVCKKYIEHNKELAK